MAKEIASKGECEKEISGFVNLNKPAGMTSFKCVSAVRRITGVKKTGHAGTLDPEATGVLPVCIGKATKCSDYFLRMGKSYRAELLLGISSNTMDIWGEIISENYSAGDVVTKEQILCVLDRFRGEITQIPPAFSAIKKDGVPLYKLARQGIDVEVESRTVTVYKLDLIEFFKDGDGHTRAVIDVHCSKGTYIRSICNDIGGVLGCGAVMSKLVRTSYGELLLENSVTLEELEKAFEEGRGGLLVAPVETIFENYSSVDISEKEKQDYIHGKQVKVDVSRVRTVGGYDDICVYFKGELLAIAQKEKAGDKIWLRPFRFFGD
ncbi:MAG: tRNA pseudouridine(55) synthase TruB [Clostridia bacterium]|nr:tRNA pseudouridine(55) synthase TruB [Clostridia bacterium]